MMMKKTSLAERARFARDSWVFFLKIDYGICKIAIRPVDARVLGSSTHQLDLTSLVQRIFLLVVDRGD